MKYPSLTISCWNHPSKLSWAQLPISGEIKNDAYFYNNINIILFDIV